VIVRKLKSALKPQTASLFLKAVAFALLAGLVTYSRSPWWIAALLVWAVHLYLVHVRGRTPSLSWTFWSFVAVSVVISRTSMLGSLNVPLYVALGVVLYLMLGTTALRFENFRVWGSVAYYLLVFAAVALLIQASPWNRAWWAIPATFAFFFLTGREYIQLMTGVFSRRLSIFRLIIALMATQIVWAASLLSVGFLSAAALVLVFVMGVFNLQMRYFAGLLDRRNLLKDTAFFGAFLVLTAVLLLVL
jgi:hypothetical protein